MKKLLIKIPVKLRLYLPLLMGIIISIAIVTWFSIYNFRKDVNHILKENLIQETRSIVKMLERENNYKLEKVKNNIKIAHNLFYSKPFRITNEKIACVITNQFTKNKSKITINKWFLDGEELFGNNKFVDNAIELFGGTITVFQKTDSGFVRISTNVLTNDSLRAIGTFIPMNSPVAKKINSGQNYIGRAFVVNDWNITAYEPIIINKKVIGMLYVGDKEKDLDIFRNTIKDFHIGKSGYVFILDEKKESIIFPPSSLNDWKASGILDKITTLKNGFIQFKDEKDNILKYVSFNYFEPFKYYVVAVISPQNESKAEVSNIVVSSVITAFIIILIFSTIVYFITTESVHLFLRQLDLSNKRLVSTREALKESENRFQSLFNSTSDDILLIDLDLNIIEVNNQVCETLGFSRDELLRLKMIDVKSAKAKENNQKITEDLLQTGKLSYETELVTKTSVIIPVEMNCRLIEYNNIKYILSVARNISERKKMERKILSAVIQAEEKERERLSKDLHDGLGPLLSAIKIYLNELISGEIDEKEKEDINKYSIELIDEAILTTRVVSNNLMPRVMSNYGLVKAIESFCKKINLTNKTTIEFNSVNYSAVDQTTELIIYRVVNELLNNTIKHASAQHVNILLEVKDTMLSLTYEDDGIGFDFEKMLDDPRTGMGLKNILSRVKSVDGIIQADKAIEKGFRIVIQVKTEIV